MYMSSLMPARVNPLLIHPAECRLSLDGVWHFALDAEDRGSEEHWYTRPERLSDTIQVPGCWQGQGFGGDGEDVLWDFQLHARTFRATYTGTGWYGRAFTVPADWQGKQIWLNFGGVHPSAEIWLNGVRIGEHDLPFVPFAFDITPHLCWECENTLVVRVHEYHREFGMAFSWQGNWSGLYRGVELTATGASYLRQCALYPDARTGCLRLAIELGGTANSVLPMLQVAIRPAESDLPVTAQAIPLPANGQVEISVPDHRLWSPDAPHLYRVDVALMRGEETLDACSERTGFISLRTAGKHIMLNDDPTTCVAPATFFPARRPDARIPTVRVGGANCRHCGIMVTTTCAASPTCMVRSITMSPTRWACWCRARWGCWAPGVGRHRCTSTSGPNRRPTIIPC